MSAKVRKITIWIEDDDGGAATSLDYDDKTGSWEVKGRIYPKHLGLMTVIVEYLKEHQA